MKWKLGISKKYAFYVSALSLVLLTVILISVSIIVWREANTLKVRLREGVKETYEKSYKTMIINRSRSFSYVIFNSLYRLDINGMNHLIKNLKAEMPIKSVLIADASGKVLTDGTAENPSFETILNADFPTLKSRQSFLIRTAEGHIVTFIVALGDHIAGYGEILFLDDPLKSAVQQQDEIVFSMWKETQRRFRGIALIGVLSILFFTVFLGLLFSRRLSFQLLKLRDATKKVAKGDLHCRLEVQSRDELGDLADSFNQMAEELLVTTVSKDYMDNIIKNMNDSLIVVSPDGTIETVNQATLDLLGYTQDELSNQPFGIIFEEEKLASECAGLNDLMKEGSLSVRNIEKTYLSKDGRKIPVLLSGSVMRDGDGKIQGIVYVALDITKRKQAEEELRKHREHLEELVKNRTIELTETNKQLQEEIDERNWAEESLIRSEEEARRLAQENAIMAEIGRIISSTLNIEEVYERFAEEVRKLIPSDRISVSINNPEDSTVTIAYVTGVEIGDRRQGDTIPLTSSINKEIIRTRSGLLIQAEEEGELINRLPLLLTSFQAGFQSMMSVPLFSKDEVIGVLHLRSIKPNAYTERDLRIAERVGNQIAGAIANAQLFIERKRAEEALRESEEKYRTILENIEDGYFEVDITGNLTFFNDSVCRMLGYSRDELMGMNNRQYTDTENAKKLYQAFNKVYQTGEPAKAFDWEAIRKDGAKRFGEVSISLIRDSKGQPIGFRGIGRDITERKQAEETLQRSEEEARRLAQENAIMAEIGRIINSTLNIEEVYERFAEEVRKLLPFDRIAVNITNPDERTITVAYVTGVEIAGRRQGDTIPLAGSLNEEIIRTRSGLLVQTGDEGDLIKRVPNLLTTFQAGLRSMISIPLISKNEVIGVLHILSTKPNAYTEKDLRLAERVGNQIAGAIANAQLFIERKRAEEALRKSEEKFRELYDNAPVGYHEFDTEGRITRVNQTELKMLGYSSKEMLGQPVWKFIVEKETQERAKAKLTGDIPVGKLFERTYRKKDGTTFPVLIDDRLLRDDEGRIIGIRSTIQDITERKRIEKEKENLEDQLSQSQKIEAIGRLAGGIAHDFNNLLTVIKGYSQLSLVKLKEGDPLKGNIEEIHAASQRATDLTQQLLAFSRRQILEFKVLDLNTVLQDMDKMLHRLIGKDIELVYLLSDHLGKVRTDPGQIEQMILNLTVNARDAMPSGGKLTIETADVELDETHTHTRISITPGRYVMLSVSDTGCGMSPEVKEHLFEPFFTTREKDKGTGLGLSTIYGIVKQSAGDVWVYSEPGQGTTFKIYLPRVEEEASTLPHGDDKGSLPNGRETILLVEDEPYVKRFAARVLRENGYNLLEAANGNEALRMVQEYAGEIHLLLTDVVMPQMGGKELADRLKPLRPGIKVLFTSGYTGNAIVRQGVLGPGIDFLQKPFSPAALAQKAREVLGK